jgi:putative Holliday junction resolvase
MRLIASPHAMYERRSPDLDAAFFVKLVEEEQLAMFVVGLPVHMSGDESEKSIEARAFGAWLSEAVDRPVEFFDERFTSKQADEYMAVGKLSRQKKKLRRDMIAAQVILSNYLERGGDSNRRPESIRDEPDRDADID